jgi:hypothetical protein
VEGGLAFFLNSCGRGLSGCLGPDALRGSPEATVGQSREFPVFCYYYFFLNSAARCPTPFTDFPAGHVMGFADLRTAALRRSANPLLPRTWRCERRRGERRGRGIRRFSRRGGRLPCQLDTIANATTANHPDHLKGFSAPLPSLFFPPAWGGVAHAAVSTTRICPASRWRLMRSRGTF